MIELELKGIKLTNLQRGVDFMSVHFFFNYREHLIKKLKEHYGTIVELKKADESLQIQLEEAENIIRDYFEVVAIDLQEVLNAASNEVQLDYDSEDYIVKFTIVDNYVRFIRRPTAIEVEISRYDDTLNMNETFIIAYVVPGEKKCHTKKVGMVHEGGSFDENSLNYFMREAFGEIVQYEEQQ